MMAREATRTQRERPDPRTLGLTLGIGATSLLALPLALDLRFERTARPLGEAWRTVPIAPRRSTALGISFRPPQVDALGLDAREALVALLSYPFQIIRLGAYWNRIETAPGIFDASELDWQIDAVERAGKRVVLCVGAVKNFSYPEFFVPRHRLDHALPEHSRIGPADHRSLLDAATEFVRRVVERYRDRPSIYAWQVENEGIDPLGIEHSWRLDRTFVQAEIEAARQADPTRPILLNGFFPTTFFGALAQWWQTRDQGDSLTLAQSLADIIGIDYYPRYALAGLGAWTLYLDGTRNPWTRRRLRGRLAGSKSGGPRLIVSEGQAEPWETSTIPPNHSGKVMSSCPPEQIIHNYNAWLGPPEAAGSLEAYLFWGAEYWVLRQRSGDPSYLKAFSRILESS